MERISSHEIDRLRQRIQRAAARLPGGEGPPPPRLSTAPRPPGPAGAPSDVGGEERESPMGRYTLLERLYPNHGMHGTFRLQALQSISPNWLADISGGQLEAVDPAKWAFLDTETTGLAGGTGTCAFLVGIGAVEERGFRVRLFFMRDFDQEQAMLQAVAERLEGYDALVTYNGRAFDVPLLETRFRLRRLGNPLERLQHLDLLAPARRVWKARMPNCRLATLESAVLGFEREGDVPGALIPQRYFDFLRSGDGRGLRPVFHHNMLDLLSLACLATVLMPAYAAAGEAALRHGEDLAGLARWLQRQGDDDSALQLYRRAIQAGLPDSGLFSTLWESARLERRNGNRYSQLRLLESLSRVANDYRSAAFEELAKYYEHSEKDFERALEMTRSAQRCAPSDLLAHRERRLLRKSGDPPSGRSAAAPRSQA